MYQEFGIPGTAGDLKEAHRLHRLTQILKMEKRN
jgi:hypothetical protein